jgi:hypothetical protein
MLVVRLYVDDMIYIGTNEVVLQSVEQFRRSMKQQFDMSDLGLSVRCMGMRAEINWKVRPTCRTLCMYLDLSI